MKKFKVAGAALNQTPLAWHQNFNNIIEAIKLAKKEKVLFLALPELCICGYNCEDLFLSEWLYDSSLEWLLKVVPYTKGITVSLGLPVLFNEQNYNCVALLSDGVILGITAKQFMANEGVHYEKRWFKEWPKNKEADIYINGSMLPFGDIVYEVNGVKIGIEVCEDAWQGTNRPGVQHHLRGVHLIMVNNASHFSMGKTQQRTDLVLLGSLEFHCAYIYVNMLGNESGRCIYDGEILIAENGELVQRNNKLSYKDVDLVCATVSLTEPPQIQSDKIYFDELDKNTEFIKAASLGLFDYLRKSNSSGFVLSLSGGADSALCAVLVAEMVRRGLRELGLEGFCHKLPASGLKVMELSLLHGEALQKALVQKLLTCVYQSTENSSEITFLAAKGVAESIGAEFMHWSVDEPVAYARKTVEAATGRKLDVNADDITLQNIQARSRSPLVWMLANLKGALLLTTSNRSEASTGYATMDGDTSGSLAPIGGVDKDFVRQWLRWAERKLGYSALGLVNVQAPTAELRPPGSKQTDESDLMPYNVLQAIERKAIKYRMSPLQVYRDLLNSNLEAPKLLETHVALFFTLWSRTQWKRERYAPSFHLDDYNIDPASWCRFPVLNGGFKVELEALKAYCDAKRKQEKAGV